MYLSSIYACCCWWWWRLRRGWSWWWYIRTVLLFPILKLCTLLRVWFFVESYTMFGTVAAYQLVSVCMYERNIMKAFDGTLPRWLVTCAHKNISLCVLVLLPWLLGYIPYFCFGLADCFHLSLHSFIAFLTVSLFYFFLALQSLLLLLRKWQNNLKPWNVSRE